MLSLSPTQSGPRQHVGVRLLFKIDGENEVVHMTTKNACELSTRLLTHTGPSSPVLALRDDPGVQLPLFDGDALDVARDRSWLGFTGDHDKLDAARAFVLRYGQRPRYVLESRGLLLVGPILPPVDTETLLGLPGASREVLR